MIQMLRRFAFSKNSSQNEQIVVAAPWHVLVPPQGARAPTPLVRPHEQLPLLKIPFVNFDSICCFAQMSLNFSQFSAGMDHVTAH